MKTHAKIVACWGASWTAALLTFWILQGLVKGPEDNVQATAMLAVAIVSLAAAVAAWVGVTKWWPE